MELVVQSAIQARTCPFTLFQQPLPRTFEALLHPRQTRPPHQCHPADTIRTGRRQGCGPAMLRSAHRPQMVRRRKLSSRRLIPQAPRRLRRQAARLRQARPARSARLWRRRPRQLRAQARPIQLARMRFGRYSRARGAASRGQSRSYARNRRSRSRRRHVRARSWRRRLQRVRLGRAA